MRTFRAFLLIMLTFLPNTAVMAVAPPVKKCLPALPGEERLKKADFAFYTTAHEMETGFKELYQGKKRQPQRLYGANSNLKNSQVLIHGEMVKVPVIFLKSLINNLQLALVSGYGEQIFYSDMGHAHLLLPTAELSLLKKAYTGRLLSEKILASAQLKFLFHTGELLKLKQGLGLEAKLVEDPWLQWRYFSRNFTGTNTGTDNPSVIYSNNAFYNTVRDLPDYTEVETVYFNGHQEACLPLIYKKQTIFFDLGFEL